MHVDCVSVCELVCVCVCVLVCVFVCVCVYERRLLCIVLWGGCLG